jgi:PAS domain S-box-containing protein
VPRADSPGSAGEPLTGSSVPAWHGSEQRFRLLVENVRDYEIIMLDVDGKIVSWNSGAQQLKGYTPEEVIGRHFSLFSPPEAVARGWPEEELRLAAARGRFEDEGWRVRKDGSLFWANVVITAMRDENGVLHGYAKVTRDMSERKRLEALEEARGHMSQFLAMLAHELRNPLAPLRNVAGVMRDLESGNTRLRWCREVLDRQLTHLARLVEDLLDVGRITTGQVLLRFEPVQLEDVLQQAVEDATPFVDRRRHTLELIIPDSGLWVKGDRTRLAQVLINLLDNSAKYTPEGGHIRITAESEDGYAVVRIMDNGRGIPAKLLPKVFDVFVQGDRKLDRAEGGLGLGLAVVKTIVEQHDGHVEAMSGGPDAGSQFTVRLPLTGAPHARETGEPAGSSGQCRAGEAPRVLVVDDNRDSADSMTMLLNLHGYVARAAYRGEDALDVAADLRPHAVLLDIGLPGMDGYEVAERLRALPELAGAMLIAMTGYGQAEDRARSAAAGFSHHLVKPVDLETLHALLRSNLP